MDPPSRQRSSQKAQGRRVVLTIITIDLGTSVCKVQAFGTDGKERRQFSQEIETSHPNADWAEQDPENWWRVVRAGVRKCIEGNEEIDAIGVCSHRESILALDDKGNVVLPCILWADRRCKAEAKQLSHAFGTDIHQRTGMKPDPYFTAPKLLWVRRNQPDILERTEKFLLPKDYIIYQLTGSFSTDWTVASRTMMLEIRKKEWWSEMLEFVGVAEEQMCSPTDSNSVVGQLTPDAARQLKLGNQPEVVAGAGDRQCEALGSGVSLDRVMESTGSATNVSISTKDLPRHLAEGLLFSCHALRDQYLVEQGIGSTGLALRWFRDTFLPPSDEDGFRANPYAFIDVKASASPPGANGLIFLPFLMGAQATRWNPDARGVFFGLSLGHTYGDLARSVLEGVAFEIRASIEVLAQEGMNPSTILALGGSAKSRIWNQIKADITGRTYSKPRTSGAASIGAMILGCQGCGIPTETAIDLNPIETSFRPNPRNSSTYENACARYERLYEASAEVFST